MEKLLVVSAPIIRIGLVENVSYQQLKGDLIEAYNPVVLPFKGHVYLIVYQNNFVVSADVQ